MTVYYPDWVPSRVTPTSTSVSRVSSSPQDVYLAAGRRARINFGTVRIPAEIAAVKVSNYLYLLAVWGVGEIDSITKVTYGDDLELPDRVDYTGTSTQGVDPWLAAAITDYADTLRGTVYGRSVSLAYSVVRTRSTDANPAGTLNGTLKGLKLYDPRTTSTTWSSNPALALAYLLDLVGETVDWTSIEDAADYCDEAVSGEDRWSINLSLSSPQSIASAIDGLRGYGHLMVVRGASGIGLVPDGPTTAGTAITAADIVEGSMEISRTPRRQAPSVVRVFFTDTSTIPWKRRSISAERPEVATGEVPYRVSEVSMEGVHSYQQAYRHALERLNGAWLRDLRLSFRVFDPGLELQPGDVRPITHPVGLTAKQVRIVSALSPEPGRWEVTAEEYDEAVYSDEIGVDPTTPDTTLPDPFDVPAVTNLAATEEVYQLDNGTYASRFRVSWDASVYPYSAQASVCIFDGADIAWNTLTTAQEVATGPLKEGVSYSIRVCLQAAVGVTGPQTSILLTAQGKQLIPSDVPALYGIEVGGEVRLHWDAAVDLDIWRYEVRYGSTSTAWADAVLLDRVDGLRLVTADVPEGTWRFFVKALDSVGQYSTNAATKDIVVTRDARAFFVGDATLSYSSGVSSNIYEDTYRDGSVIRWSECGTVIETLFPNNLETYTDIAACYDSGCASEWESAAYDYGDTYTGTWAFDARAITALCSGSITINYELSTDNLSWDTYTTQPIKATARYARVRVTTASGNVLIDDGTDVTIRLDVVTREETGTVTTSASAAATVTLTDTYEFANWIGLQASGTSAVQCTYDNVVTGSPTTFDVYAFNSSGTQISTSVAWRFQGV